MEKECREEEKSLKSGSITINPSKDWCPKQIHWAAEALLINVQESMLHSMGLQLRPWFLSFLTFRMTFYF